MDGEEISSLSRDPQYYISNFYTKELRSMQGRIHENLHFS